MKFSRLLYKRNSSVNPSPKGCRSSRLTRRLKSLNTHYTFYILISETKISLGEKHCNCNSQKYETTTKTANVCLVQRKINLDFNLPTSIYSFWCEENIVLVLQVIILFVDGYSVEFCRISTEIIPKAGGNGR